MKSGTLPLSGQRFLYYTCIRKMNLQWLQLCFWFFFDIWKLQRILRILKLSPQKSWIASSKSKFRAEGHVNNVKWHFWKAVQFWLCEEREDSRPLFLQFPLADVIKVFSKQSVSKPGSVLNLLQPILALKWELPQSYFIPDERRVPSSSESSDFSINGSEKPGLFVWFCILPPSFFQSEGYLPHCVKGWADTHHSSWLYTLLSNSRVHGFRVKSCVCVWSQGYPTRTHSPDLPPAALLVLLTQQPSILPVSEECGVPS